MSGVNAIRGHRPIGDWGSLLQSRVCDAADSPPHHGIVDGEHAIYDGLPVDLEDPAVNEVMNECMAAVGVNEEALWWADPRCRAIADQDKGLARTALATAIYSSSAVGDEFHLSSVRALC